MHMSTRCVPKVLRACHTLSQKLRPRNNKLLRALTLQLLFV